VVLFERPKPIERDWKEDSFCHTAFSTSKEDFDLALEKMREWVRGFTWGPLATEADERFTFSIPRETFYSSATEGSSRSAHA
jgi:hypothetical protein